VESLIAAEDDQEFLSKHKEIIEKDKSQEGNKGSRGGLMQSLQNFGAVPPTPTTPENVVASKPTIPVSPDKPTTSSALHGASPGWSASPEVKPSGQGGGNNEHQVLADFFNSLINKDPHRAPLTNVRKPTADLPVKSSGSTSSSRSGSLTSANREDVAKQLDKLRNKYQKAENEN